MLSLSLKATQGCWPYHGESECYIILACGLNDPEPSEKSAESQCGRYCSNNPDHSQEQRRPIPILIRWDAHDFGTVVIRELISDKCE